MQWPCAAGGGHHSPRQDIAGGIHDHSYGNERQVMRFGNLGDRKTLHVHRCGTSLAKCRGFVSDGSDHLCARQQLAACHWTVRSNRSPEPLSPIARRQD